jgi:hypothetical protein
VYNRGHTLADLTFVTDVFIRDGCRYP